MTASEISELLGLEPLLREGGYFKETYRSTLSTALEKGGSRSCGTAIYYLLTPETHSAIHRLRFDEMYHFYLGDTVEMLQLGPGREAKVHALGKDLFRGERQQLLVPANTWQGSRLRRGGRFALMGTTMSPGFDFADYEAGDLVALSGEYPAFRSPIEELLR